MAPVTCGSALFTRVNWPVMVWALDAAAGPVLPARSVTVVLLSPKVTVPSVGVPACDTVTVYAPAPLPDTPDTVQPVDVPPTLKSPVPRPVTGSSKVTL